MSGYHGFHIVGVSKEGRRGERGGRQGWVLTISRWGLLYRCCVADACLAVDALTGIVCGAPGGGKAKDVHSAIRVPRTHLLLLLVQQYDMDTFLKTVPTPLYSVNERGAMGVKINSARGTTNTHEHYSLHQ